MLPHPDDADAPTSLPIVPGVALDGPWAARERRRRSALDPAWVLEAATALLTARVAVSPRKLVSSGVLPLALACLSAGSDELRALAYGIVGLYFEAIARPINGFGEQQQLRLLLNVVRASVRAPLQRLPAAHCLFAADAAVVLLQAEHPLYSQVNKTLLARPFFVLRQPPFADALVPQAAQEAKGDKESASALAAATAGAHGSDPRVAFFAGLVGEGA